MRGADMESARVTERNEQEQDDYENDPWLYQFLAGQRERKRRSFAIGCLFPLILIPVMIILMAILMVIATNHGLSHAP